MHMFTQFPHFRFAFFFLARLESISIICWVILLCFFSSVLCTLYYSDFNKQYNNLWIQS